MNKVDRIQYLKSVVEQYYTKDEKPTKKGWRLLEDENKTFEQLMKECSRMKNSSDKACAILKAVEKANDEKKILELCEKITAIENCEKIINLVDTAYPDSIAARKVIESVQKKYYENILARKMVEVEELRKELRKITKSLKM